MIDRVISYARIFNDTPLFAAGLLAGGYTAQQWAAPDTPLWYFGLSWLVAVAVYVGVAYHRMEWGVSADNP